MFLAAKQAGPMYNDTRRLPGKLFRSKAWWALSDDSRYKTDLSLLERMGDSRHRSQAWAIFVDRYTQLFFLWFKHLNVDPHVMEDVLQETMMRVLRNLKYFEHRRQGSFRAWLHLLATHSWLQLMADTERQLAERPPADPGRLAEQWRHMKSPMAEDHLKHLFDAWATEELLSMATARVRRRVGLDVWATYERVTNGQEPVKAVAEAQGLKASQVYDRVSHVKKLLRQEFNDLGGDQP